MSKSLSEVPSPIDAAPSWLALDTISPHRELTSIEGLVREACLLVHDEAHARSLYLVPVPVSDEIVIAREHVVFVLSMLLRGAIDAVPAGARVAITGQPMDRDVVFGIYDSGPHRAKPTRFGYIARQVAYALGGYVWSGDTEKGNLAMFSLPLWAGTN